MYRWELDGPAQQEFVDLRPGRAVSLAAFLDAVVIVDPVQSGAAATSVMTCLCRCAHCISARTAGAWSRSWFIRLMISCW